jgi:hypothetical protein
MSSMHGRDAHLQLDVGRAERPVVDVTWGKFVVLVDGVPAVRERYLFGFKRARRYEVSVGRSEVHRLLIEKCTIPFSGSVLPQTFEFFVDRAPVRPGGRGSAAEAGGSRSHRGARAAHENAARTRARFMGLFGGLVLLLAAIGFVLSVTGHPGRALVVPPVMVLLAFAFVVQLRRRFG